MDFKELLEKVSAEPVFETSLLLAGNVRPAGLQMQLSRWERDGRIIQLRRGLYALAAVYQKTKPHPFFIANRLQPASYVSLQSALSHHGLIPEAVMEITSVTSVRPRSWHTALGTFRFRKVKQDWFHSYQRISVSDGQYCFMASAEKALLDLIYLEPGSDSPAYLQELRLQNTERLNLAILSQLAQQAQNSRVVRACEMLLPLLKKEQGEFKPL